MEPLFSLASTITAIPRWRSCSGCIPGRPEPHGQPEADQGADGTRLPSARRCRKPSRLLCRSDRRLKNARQRQACRREAFTIAHPDRSSASSLGPSGALQSGLIGNGDPAAVGVAQGALLISFTSSKQHGTPLYRSSCARKPRPLFRADMFQPLDAPRLVPRTAMYPRNPLACRQPSLELFDFR
jgi:hypothetical protein